MRLYGRAASSSTLPLSPTPTATIGSRLSNDPTISLVQSTTPIMPQFDTLGTRGMPGSAISSGPEAPWTGRDIFSRPVDMPQTTPPPVQGAVDDQIAMLPIQYQELYFQMVNSGEEEPRDAARYVLDKYAADMANAQQAAASTDLTNGMEMDYKNMAIFGAAGLVLGAFFDKALIGAVAGALAPVAYSYIKKG